MTPDGKGGVMNLKGFIEAVQRHKRVTIKGLRVGLYRAGNLLKRESQLLVPIEEDVLRPSCETRWEEGQPAEKPMRVVSYSTEYAVYVHENLEARHKPGKQAKYLEQPFREKRFELRKLVLEAVDGVWEGHGGADQ